MAPIVIYRDGSCSDLTLDNQPQKSSTQLFYEWAERRRRARQAELVGTMKQEGQQMSEIERAKRVLANLKDKRRA